MYPDSGISDTHQEPLAVSEDLSHDITDVGSSMFEDII